MKQAPVSLREAYHAFFVDSADFVLWFFVGVCPLKIRIDERIFGEA